MVGDLLHVACRACVVYKVHHVLTTLQHRSDVSMLLISTSERSDVSCGWHCGLASWTDIDLLAHLSRPLLLTCSFRSSTVGAW